MEVLTNCVQALRSAMFPQPRHFPFEKLPQELRLHILEFAKPQQGFLPLPEVSDTMNWDLAHDGNSIKTAPSEDVRPESILLTNKWISTEARKLLRKSAIHYITLDAFRVHYLDRTLYLVDQFPIEPEIPFKVAVRGLPVGISCEDLSNNLTFPNHLLFTRMPFFRHMRHYHLDLSFDSPKWSLPHVELSSAMLHLQETIRTLADALSMNEDIKSLEVAIPCECYIRKTYVYGQSHMYSYAISDLLEYLDPLSRLSVEDPVEFVAYSDIDRRGARVSCPKVSCRRLAHMVTAELGHLRGASLTETEERWKWLKTLPRAPISNLQARQKANRALGKAWNCLNNDDIVGFERVTESITEASERHVSQPHSEKALGIGHFVISFVMVWCLDFLFFKLPLLVTESGK
ncbi:MAG: hypothetical protein LQ352_006105 [Teloschistes flavicans]|nr:MAG: hypothetical protein LQ352_006105 [Teloschistes flavicans]